MGWPATRGPLVRGFTVYLYLSPLFYHFRCIPARLKDKLASHIFVLALMIEDFALEFTDLQQDLKIGVPK